MKITHLHVVHLNDGEPSTHYKIMIFATSNCSLEVNDWIVINPYRAKKITIQVYVFHI